MSFCPRSFSAFVDIHVHTSLVVTRRALFMTVWTALWGAVLIGRAVFECLTPSTQQRPNILVWTLTLHTAVVAVCTACSNDYKVHISSNCPNKQSDCFPVQH